MVFLLVQGGIVGSMDGTCRFFEVIGITVDS